MAPKVIIAYIPVLHLGYFKLFESNPAYHHGLYVLADQVVDTDRSLQKDIRRLNPRLAAQAIRAWNMFDFIEVADSQLLAQLSKNLKIQIMMPDEDISRQLATKYFAQHQVEFYPIFLRWDRQAVGREQTVVVDAEITTEQLHQVNMRLAAAEAARSTDIWRHVGAALAKDGKVVAMAHNQSRPTKYSAWLDGDPRNLSQQGADLELSTSQHAEAQAIAQAARAGVATAGADLFVTTFPCPTCAQLIAAAGIKQLFFSEGYSLLDGQDILKAAGAKIVRVQPELPAENPAGLLPYPEVKWSPLGEGKKL